MKRLLLIAVTTILVCGCESRAVKHGREAYKLRLSGLYYEYTIDKEIIVSEVGDKVEYSVIARVRECDGEPYKLKSFRFVCEDDRIISCD